VFRHAPRNRGMIIIPPGMRSIRLLMFMADNSWAVQTAHRRWTAM
jgi:hypothetical protein